MKDPRNPFPEGTPPEGIPKTPEPDTPVTEKPSEGVPETTDPDAPVIEESPEGGFPDDGPAPEPEPEWQGPIQEVEIDIDNVTPTAGPEPVKAKGDREQPAKPIPKEAPPKEAPPEGVPVPIPEQPTTPMPTEAPPEGVPVPIPEQPTTPMPTEAPPEGVPVPIPEQPTTPMPTEAPPEGVPVPIPEQPTLPMKKPEDPFPTGTPPEGVPVPIHEQPTIKIPKGTPPEGVPAGDDAVPVPIDDGPSGFWDVPSDGVPEVSRPHDEFPVREAAMDDPDKTGRWQRPEDTVPGAPRPEDGGPGRVRAPSGVEPAVVTTLPDGSLVYGAPDQPFTLADADRVYLGLIDETPYREAQIIEDIDSGECIVIQGSTIDVAIDPAARASFLADRPWLTRWRTVRHNHPIGRGRVTPRGQRYPSVADMRGAEQQAHQNFRPQNETLDVATEQGRHSIPFGYDQTQKQPFWVDVPDASGVSRRERFTNVFEYQVWREQQLQGPG